MIPLLRHCASRPGARKSRCPAQTARRPLWPLAIAVLAGAWSLPACNQHEPAVRTAAPVAVHAPAVSAQSMPGTVEAFGSLHGVREAVVAAKVMGTVVEVRRHAGDPVRRGEILLRLDGREVAGQIGQAEGALAQAKAAAALADANCNRFEQLVSHGAASQLELDQARYQRDTALGAVQQAEAAVATAGSYRSYADIPAPFDGRVVDKLCEVGDLAAPGRPLMRVEDASRVQLVVRVSEAQAGAAQVGAAVTVVVPALGDRSLVGRVAEVAPAIDPATRSLQVKIDLPEDAQLRSGLFARASLSVGTRAALRVPRGALVERGGLTGVYVAEAGRAIYRLVEVSPAAGDSVLVLAGLSDGERVVLTPPTTLVEGAAVEVLP